MPDPSDFCEYNTAMRSRRASFIRTAVLLCMTAGMVCGGEVPAQTVPRQEAAQPPGPSTDTGASDALAELQTGASLTRQGYLQQAIPHLLAARRAGLDPYAVSVNLGICYLGTERYRDAIAVLQEAPGYGSRRATVENLLAQAYMGNGQQAEALRAFRRAAAVSPKDEKLYAFMADACTDHQDYAVGLQVVEQGLRELPDSARLHYERAVFLGRLGRLDEGKPEFDRAAQLAPGSYIGYLAQVQKDLYVDDLRGADTVLHDAIAAGQSDYRMLSLLGTVLLHEGAAPGQPQFAEAVAALERSAAEQPNYSATQIALGKVYLMQGNPQKAMEHLEIGRRLEPENPSVYANLASAYEELGEKDKARSMRQQIGRLLAEKKAVGQQ